MWLALPRRFASRLVIGIALATVGRRQPLRLLATCAHPLWRALDDLHGAHLARLSILSKAHGEHQVRTRGRQPCPVPVSHPAVLTVVGDQRPQRCRPIEWALAIPGIGDLAVDRCLRRPRRTEQLLCFVNMH